MQHSRLKKLEALARRRRPPGKLHVVFVNDWRDNPTPPEPANLNDDILRVVFVDDWRSRGKE